MNNVNNKRIAKNTILLYFRMFLILGVSLYTARVVLRVLGVEDFGIYSIVGGVVTMLSFLSGAMSSGTQRHLSFALGHNDQTELKSIFSATLTIHIAIAIIIFLIAESLGLWFMNHLLVIPADRMVAANWVYQFSILSFMITVIQIPYKATLIAHEKMDAFALISIVEVGLKLTVVFLLQYFNVDKLSLYGGLLFGTTLITGGVYKVYCSRIFSITKYQFTWESRLLKELISYAGWNLWGGVAGVGFNQGLNILINIFFGPTVNAARTIAYQVSATIGQFVGGFQMAMNPQLVKSYAAGHTDEMLSLMKRGSKFSFLLMFLLIIPVLFHTDYVLELWLGIVPKYTVIFCQLALITALIDSFSGTLMTASQATGKIKLYQSVVGGLLLLNVPVSYVFLKLGYPPPITVVIAMIVAGVAFIARLFILQKILPFHALSFLKDVVSRPFLMGIITMASYYFVTPNPDGAIELTLSIVIVELFAIVLLVTVGLNNDERKFIFSKIKTIVKRRYDIHRR